MQTFKYQEDLNESMATITINVSDKVTRRFREMVKHQYGESKGVLGRAITEAMEHWIDELQQEEIATRQLQLSEKGFKLGRKLYAKRGDLYERKH